MSVKLLDVTRDLNIGIPTVVDFLLKKGHAVDNNPYARISYEQFELIVYEFFSFKEKRESLLCAFKQREEKEALRKKNLTKSNSTKDRGKTIPNLRPKKIIPAAGYDKKTQEVGKILLDEQIKEHQEEIKPVNNTPQKRYQVFVSSTYQDLEDERRDIIQALIELDCIPVGMEYFPASDIDQWNLIKPLISQCDYYILIIGGRYGSVHPTKGISYTQMEYEYALEQGIPTISFIHKNPGKISFENSEQSEEGRIKLETFKELAKKKMCKFWKDRTDLNRIVPTSITKLMDKTPRTGWVRGDSFNEELLKLREKKEALQRALESLKAAKAANKDNFSRGS